MFFRYRETNDNLVAAFIYLVRKLTESAKGYAKQRIVEDVTIVRTKLKSAGSLLKYFIDTDMDDDLSFGDVRKKAFELIPADSIKLLSDHLDNNDFDGRQYEWQFIDKQSSKIKPTNQKDNFSLKVRLRDFFYFFRVFFNFFNKKSNFFVTKQVSLVFGAVFNDIF